MPFFGRLNVIRGRFGPDFPFGIQPTKIRFTGRWWSNCARAGGLLVMSGTRPTPPPPLGRHPRQGHHPPRQRRLAAHDPLMSKPPPDDPKREVFIWVLVCL